MTATLTENAVEYDYEIDMSNSTAFAQGFISWGTGNGDAEIYLRFRSGDFVARRLPPHWDEDTVEGVTSWGTLWWSTLKNLPLAETDLDPYGQSFVKRERPLFDPSAPQPEVEETEPDISVEVEPTDIVSVSWMNNLPTGIESLPTAEVEPVAVEHSVSLSLYFTDEAEARTATIVLHDIVSFLRNESPDLVKSLTSAMVDTHLQFGSND